MKNETFLDFCFIREEEGGFYEDIHHMLTSLFKGQRLHWYLDERIDNGVEIIIAEVKGMSKWSSEKEVEEYLEYQADESFWKVIQGYHFRIYPAEKGCATCGNRS
ncbi:hypothetical protein [Halobacillus sp. Marseille-P3879]|uniref:hypothetical protein n=1 Tax=Halobacillus sp. Marseille-P3879 TaxID=2045014 RepID=UPI000C7A6025|nr:hypothetical protein [Halobacillus sp. Marseille-P3879]